MNDPGGNDTGSLQGVSVLLFDVFGTLTDWHSSVAAEGARLAGTGVDWAEFVLRWRVEGYLQQLPRIASGEAPFRTTETLHREHLDVLLAEYGLTGLADGDRERLVSAWARIDAWPDVREGLVRLRRRFTVMPFSNGDPATLAGIARHNELEWDGLISGNFFGKVKPDPTVYADAIHLLRCRPEEVLMVACHTTDLVGARNAGMRTAYVARPREFGPELRQEQRTEAFDVEVGDLSELDRALGGAPS